MRSRETRLNKRRILTSLGSRLLVSVSLLLVLFFGATIVVLDIAFREAGEQAQEDILDTQLMALIAEAEPNADGELVMPPDLREPRFGNLGSGLYGALSDETDSKSVYRPGESMPRRRNESHREYITCTGMLRS